MSKKQLLRVVAFALVFCAMIYGLCDLFECENTTNYDMRFTSYRNFQKDTVDAVYFGSSGVDRYWIPAKAYEEYGMVVYPLSSDAMPSWLYVDMIKEAFVYQNPELLIFDVRPFTQGIIEVETTDVRARRVLDALGAFSQNRLQVALKSARMMREIDNTLPSFDLSYIFSFIKYHSSWSSKNFRFGDNLGNEEHAFGGFYLSKKLNVKKKPLTPTLYSEGGVEALDPASEAALFELLNYVDEHDYKVLFVDTPQFKSGLELARSKRVYEILDAEQRDYIAYYMPEQQCPNTDSILSMNMDPATDFYDKGHANYYGAEKFTDVFAAYLNEHYTLPDRRQDKTVSDTWDGLYKAIKNEISAFEHERDAELVESVVEEEEPVDGAPVVEQPEDAEEQVAE